MPIIMPQIPALQESADYKFGTTWNAFTNWLVFGSKYDLSQPPVVRSTNPDGSSIPVVPVSGEAANQTIQDVTNQEIIDWQGQNNQFMSNLNEKVNSDGSGISWLTMGLIGIGIVGLVVVLGDSGSRRYGR